MGESREEKKKKGQREGRDDVEKEKKMEGGKG